MIFNVKCDIFKFVTYLQVFFLKITDSFWRKFLYFHLHEQKILQRICINICTSKKFYNEFARAVAQANARAEPSGKNRPKIISHSLCQIRWKFSGTSFNGSHKNNVTLFFIWFWFLGVGLFGWFLPLFSNLLYFFNIHEYFRNRGKNHPNSPKPIIILFNFFFIKKNI